MQTKFYFQIAKYPARSIKVKVKLTGFKIFLASVVRCRLKRYLSPVSKSSEMEP